jgi:hypothetical protein
LVKTADLLETGLLEQQALWLGPPAAAPRELRGAGGVAVGEARPTGRRGWWPWSPVVLLTVHETHDCPLLCTLVRRGWLSPVIEVQDADDRTVGTIDGDALRDRFGCVWARVSAAGGHGEVRHEVSGRCLAEWQEEGGRQLRFRPDVQTDPFAKMLILAAALVT